MVIIRLSRGGSNKRPFYHMVATDSRNKRDGRYLEQLGYFNPIARGGETRLFIQIERLEYWQSVGAQLSDRVTRLLKDYKKVGTEPSTEKKVKPAAEKTEKTKAKSKKAEVAAVEQVETPSEETKAE